MCSRGVFQLRNIKFQYCDLSGSSKGVRSLLQTQKLDKFLEENPHIKLDMYLVRGSHPYIRTEYINGWNRTVSLRNFSDEEIIEALSKARGQAGHKAWKLTGSRVFSSNQSIQGRWTPNTWGSNYMFREQSLRKLPDFPLKVQLKDKTEKKKEIKYSEKEENFMKKKIVPTPRY